MVIQKRGNKVNLHNLQAVTEKRSGKLTTAVLRFHDDAPVHKNNAANTAVRDCGFKEINHPHCSPDLSGLHSG